MAPFAMPSIPRDTVIHLVSSIPHLGARSPAPPTRILPASLASTLTSVAKRQSTTTASGGQAIVPNNYTGITQAPGQVAGIVLGSVAGAILLLWFIYTMVNMRNRGPSIEDVEVVTTRTRGDRTHRTRSTRARSRSRSEAMTEVRSPPRRERRRERSQRRETVIIEETRPRAVSRPRSPEMEDDIVEVIEEHSPPPPVRRERRMSSGYRNVDPELYGGGDRPRRKVRH
jgi:hypothetical protein